MEQDVVYLRVGSDQAESSRAILDETRDLLQELSQVGGINFSLSSQDEKAGGVRGGPVDLAFLMGRIAELGGIVSLVDVLGSWLNKDRSRTLKIQLNNKCLEASGLSKEEQKELIKWFQTQAGVPANR